MFDNKPLLLFVGRLRHYKGVNVLLDAMRTDAVQQLNAHLLVIGIGPLQEQLQQQAADCRASGKGNLWGGVDRRRQNCRLSRGRSLCATFHQSG